jgi:class 3 adenylate cyclase
MAVFGAPISHEDDAERSVRAGLRILEAITELNEADPALSLQVRIGINTGEAVVALEARPEQGKGIVTGDVVNTASRLQGAGPRERHRLLRADLPPDRADLRVRRTRARPGEGQV